jgi:hypothetical protein
MTWSNRGRNGKRHAQKEEKASLDVPVAKRWEIRTRGSQFACNRDLYVQAMYNMSKLDSHDPYSFFQIAGKYLSSAR